MCNLGGLCLWAFILRASFRNKTILSHCKDVWRAWVVRQNSAALTNDGVGLGHNIPLIVCE